MSWAKNAVVSYHFIEAANDNYLNELKLSFDSLLNSDVSCGNFDAGQSHYFWEVNSKVDITDTDTYCISVVKEKCAWPAWFKDDEGIAEIPLSDGALGEVHYAIINPASRFILSLAAAGGGPVGAFKKFLNEFSKDSSVKLTPLFEDKVDIIALSWDIYKKIAISMNFPGYDFLAEFMATPEGKLFGIADELGGLKLNLTLSAPKALQKINASQTKEIAKALLTNDFCSKLVLKGADNVGEDWQEFDLKNAQVKYKENIEIVGSYMTELEALPLLKRAFYDRSHDLLGRY